MKFMTLSIFQRFKRKTPEQELEKVREHLRKIPGNNSLTLRISNKELTGTENFRYLLSLFKHAPLTGDHTLQQNLNQTIISFSDSITGTSVLLGKLVACTKNFNAETIHALNRLPRLQENSYLFFSAFGEDSKTFDQKSLDQMLGWMENILSYYDANKVFVFEDKIGQTDEHGPMTQAIFTKLDLFYDFFYCLLCHICSIKSDNLQRIAVFVEEDF